MKIGIFLVAFACFFAALVSFPPKIDGIKAGSLVVSQQSHNLIVEYECGGEAYYKKRLSSPTWPGGASGQTIGLGYDLGYNTKAQIASDWDFLSEKTIEQLQSVAGLKGQSARVAGEKVRNIVISWDDALKVFNKKSLVRFGNLTASTYPPIKGEHPHEQGVMTSIVFNRGNSLSGSSRSEMLDIKNELIEGRADKVPKSIRSMKRLWIGKGLDGLLIRREAEACLFEKGLKEKKNP